MRDTDRKNPNEFQAPQAPQPTRGQTAAQMSERLPEIKKQITALRKALEPIAERFWEETKDERKSTEYRRHYITAFDALADAMNNLDAATDFIHDVQEWK